MTDHRLGNTPSELADIAREIERDEAAEQALLGFVTDIIALVETGKVGHAIDEMTAWLARVRTERELWQSIELGLLAQVICSVTVLNSSVSQTSVTLQGLREILEDRARA